MGDYARAAPLFQRGIQTLEELFDPEHPFVICALSRLVRFHLARGDVSLAIPLDQRVAIVQERGIAALLVTGSDEQNRAYMDTLRGYTDMRVSMHVQHAPRSREAMRHALINVLRRKGRALDSISNAFAAVRRRASHEDRALLDELRSVTAAYSALIWRRPQEMSQDAYNASSAHLAQRRVALEAQLNRQASAFAPELRPITLAQVQAALPKGAALVEMFRYFPSTFDPGRGCRSSAPRYVAYILHRGGRIAWVDLGNVGPIESAISRLRNELTRSSTHPRSAARELDALVMEPIRRWLGSTRWIFLSPDGALNLVPFSALVDENDRYLVEQYAFTYLTSGRDLLRLVSITPPEQNPVVIADPDFDHSSSPASPDPGQRPEGGARLSFSRLVSANEEGRAVSRTLGNARLLLGAEATERAVKALQGPRILHIATHGFFLEEQPNANPASDSNIGSATRASAPCLRPRIEDPMLRSGLAFTGANKPQSGNDDGVLTALEASQLDLWGTKLVVLSACETGVGETKSGDGVYGLRRAFALAGAETQVMSLWKVDDAATRELMEMYYERLLSGGGRSDSMRQVQLAMLDDPQRSHPYYWASFIVSGNPSALDGKPFVPELSRVHPSLRGCGCEIGARSPTTTGLPAALVAALGFTRLRGRRRRGT
jgi:CHAT domain-containing protein